MTCIFRTGSWLNYNHDLFRIDDSDHDNTPNGEKRKTGPRHEVPVIGDPNTSPGRERYRGVSVPTGRDGWHVQLRLVTNFTVWTKSQAPESLVRVVRSVGVGVLTSKMWDIHRGKVPLGEPGSPSWSLLYKDLDLPFKMNQGLSE